MLFQGSSRLRSRRKAEFCQDRLPLGREHKIDPGTRLQRIKAVGNHYDGVLSLYI